jgi:Spy/CpxP family protein refolding chaperone
VKRWERLLLLFSLALNVAFVTLAATRQRPSPAPQTPRGFGERFEPGGQGRDARRRVYHRVLRLDPHQALVLDREFESVEPPLREARRRVAGSRRRYAEAVVRGEAAEARAAARALARERTALDSLVAETIVRESSVLDPEQRAHYVRMVLRSHDRGPRMPMKPLHSPEAERISP